MQTNARGILLDIEGTTSSVSFVYDVMFPFVRRELDSFLQQHCDDEAVAKSCDQIAIDAGHESLEAWTQSTGLDDRKQGIKLVSSEVTRLMDDDVKATGLKSLQGLIWRSGFESGEMVAHVYDDVVPALSQWNQAKIDVRIYSSGSIGAQKLFFGHTEYGNLLANFTEHYDTTIGSKREAVSYGRIAEDFDLPATKILFVSDVVAELDAGAAAGMQTVLSLRPGNAEISETHDHASIESFAEIELAS